MMWGSDAILLALIFVSHRNEATILQFVLEKPFCEVLLLLLCYY